jgi:hypothetical protein
LKKEDKQCLDIVKRLGGMPNGKGHGEHKAFFEQVRQEFNVWAVAHGYQQHKTWRATLNKHNRLLKRMQQGDLDMQVALH